MYVYMSFVYFVSFPYIYPSFIDNTNNYQGRHDMNILTTAVALSENCFLEL